MLGKGYLCAVVTQDAANWPTPDASNHRDGEVLRKDNNLEQGGFHGVSLHHAMIKYGQAAPANPNTHGSRQGLWPTATAHTPDMESNGPNGHSGTYLAGAVKSWLTPKVPSGGSQTERTTAGGGLRKLEDQTQTQSGKLNPRWVETLMGLPIGWTMPSCIAPLTIEPTNYDSSATESCLQLQSELLEF
jgi:hypothetical protein